MVWYVVFVVLSVKSVKYFETIARKSGIAADNGFHAY
jgi:hypothetical protein